MRTRLRTVALLALMGCAVSRAALAANFYFDSRSGADANAGTTPAHAFRSLERLAALALKPGDVVRFRRGCTWRGQLNFQGNGTEGSPIRIGAYGEGPKPEILGSIRPATWERVRGELYRVEIPQDAFIGDHAVYGVFDYPPERVPMRLAGNWRNTALPADRNCWHYDKDSGYLYAITSDGKPPSEHHLEASVVSTLAILSGRSWIEIEDLTLLFGNRIHVAVRGCHDVTLRGLSSLFVGHFGNPNISITHDSRRVRVLDCFLYESANCGVHVSNGASECEVRACTIVKGRSNDGVTIHDGYDRQKKTVWLAGDHNVVEGNVIGLFPEESVDVT
ncbi:MAG: right-handed parallel beta-helix repeat-containing protein, partial [Armatimonadota bacterium]